MYKFKKTKLKIYIFPFLVLFLLFAAHPLTTNAANFTMPDDPYNNALWAYDNPGYYTHYYGSFPVSINSAADIDLNIPEAWSSYPLPKEETRTVVIAVIDTGIDFRHPDLKDQMWVNPNEIPENGIDDDGNGYIDDIHGWDFYNDDATICHYIETENGYTVDPDDNDNHGTHIAGIIAATANNSIGIAGVASNVNVQIMSLKIHGGSSSSGTVANAIKAIRYAEAMGADICNLSWGTLNYSQPLELAIRESSMLFVTAAGNNGINTNSTPMFPASLRLPNLISVAYIDNNGMLANDSNYGLSTVDIAAPGKDIFSTLVGGYGYSGGTSMAAPHITGLAAMMYAYQENVYPAQVKELIVNTMMPLDTLTGKLIHPGIPNAEAAVRSLTEVSADTEVPFLVLETSYVKEDIIIRVSPYDAGGSGVRKVRYVYGSKDIDYFFSDANGTAVLEDAISIGKPGYYTFYVEDYAGNHQIYNVYIEDDTLPPDYTVSYQVSPDYSYIVVHFSASDQASGIKTLKYLAGEFGPDTFLFAGESLDPEKPQHTFYLAPDISALTFYMTDYRGNTTTCVIHPEIIPATALYLNISERSLHYMDTFRLQPIIFPWLSTDGVHYTSSDTSVLVVDKQGLVTAVGIGEATVTVTTYSGVSAVCKFIVGIADSNIPEIPAEEDSITAATGSALTPQ